MPDEQEIVYLVRINGEPAILKCLLLSEEDGWVETTGENGVGGRSAFWARWMVRAARTLGEALEIFHEAKARELEGLQAKIRKLASLKPEVIDRTVLRPELPPLDESPI